MIHGVTASGPRTAGSAADAHPYSSRILHRLGQGPAIGGPSAAVIAAAELDLHVLSSHHDLEGVARKLDGLTAEPVEHVVSVRRIVVEQRQAPDAGLPGDFDGIGHGAVTPVRLTANSAAVY
jgi:hypothetical protein